MQKVICRFAKQGNLIYTSHLDLNRLFKRAIRRAGIPICYSNGFNPHPKLSFPLSLSVGIIGLDEVCMLNLDDSSDLTQYKDALARVLPEDIRIISMELTTARAKIRVTEVVYEVECKNAGKRFDASDADAVMCREKIVSYRKWKKKNRKVDLKPFIKSVYAEDGKLVFTIYVSQRGTTDPIEILRNVNRSFTFAQYTIIRSKVAVAIQ